MKTYTAVMLVLALLAPAAMAAMATANDSRAGALPIAGPGAIATDNRGATLSAGETRPCGAIASTIWFTFIAPASGVYKVRVESLNGGPASPATGTYDSVVAIYPHSGATAIACNDDAGGVLTVLSSQLSASLTGGAQYDIQVGGYFGDQGQGLLEITN